MKKIVNISLLALLALAWVGCENDDAAPNQTLANVTNGAVLRTIDLENDVFNAFDTASEFSLVLGEQDIEDGDLLQSVDVLVTLQKRTPSGSFADAGDETALKTLPASDFATDEFGLPRINLKVTLGEAVSALGLTAADFTGGDRIRIRLVLNLTDGRSFSVNDAAGTVTASSFFQSTYQYFAVIACIPLEPIPGDYTLDLLDNYGDGWDGAFLTVTIDGVSTDYTVSSDVGDVAVFDFTIPDGTQEFTIEYVPGSFEGEHEFKVLFNGVEAFSGGPAPTPGELVLSICL